MKFVLLMLVLVFGVWLFAHRRRSDRSAFGPSQSGSAVRNSLPQPMQPCAHCHVHMALTDMTAGQRGLYCSPEHVRQAGDRPHHG